MAIRAGPWDSRVVTTPSIAATVAAGPVMLPSSSSAETIRVAKGGSDVPGCGRGAVAPCEHIAAALGITPGAEDGDVISLGPGDFVETVSTTKNVRFVGAGAGTLDSFDPARHTRVRPPSMVDHAFTLAGSGGRLERLRIDAISGPSINTALLIDPPVNLDPKAYVLDDVTVSGSGSKQHGVLIRPSGGGTSRASVTITGPRLSGGGDDNEAQALAFGSNQPIISVLVADSFLTAAYDAIEPADGSLTIQRSTIRGGDDGIDGAAALRSSGRRSVEPARV